MGTDGNVEGLVGAAPGVGVGDDCARAVLTDCRGVSAECAGGEEVESFGVGSRDGGLLHSGVFDREDDSGMGGGGGQ